MSKYLDKNGLKYLWSKIKNMIQTEISKLNEDKSSITEQELLEKIYPVGSIYISVNATNPSNLFGGTWESIKDKFLLSAGSTYAAGNTGGKSSVTLSTSQLPSHSHSIPSLSGSASSNGSHSHTWSLSSCGTAGNHQHTGMTIDGVAISVYNGSTNSGYGVEILPNGRYSQLFTTKTGDHTHSISGTNSWNGSHTHSVTTSSSTTGTRGSGSSIDIMPPYLTVYVWKRTA